jgi:hypothetical protein
MLATRRKNEKARKKTARIAKQEKKLQRERAKKGNAAVPKAGPA